MRNAIYFIGHCFGMTLCAVAIIGGWQIVEWSMMQ